MAIQQAVIDRARGAGLELVDRGSFINVMQGKRVVAFAGTPEKAVERALARIEEETAATKPARKKKAANGDGGTKAKKNGHKMNGHAVIAPQPAIEPTPIAKALGGVMKGSIIKPQYKAKYKKNGYNCGDDLATELRIYIANEGRNGIDLNKLREVAIKNRVWKDSYLHLNPGQQRMTIGNRLRNLMVQGEKVDIGGAIFGAEQ